MEKVVRVADDLHFIKHAHREGSFVGITAVLGDSNIGLIDTGFRATILDHFLPFLMEVGHSPEEVNLVVNTHRDGDHVQGNSLVKDRTGAKIAIHELDAEAVEGIDIRLKDGDEVVLGNRRFEVIHTPGHTPGNICLHQADAQLLIVGDTLCGERLDLIRMDRETYLDSLERLLSLDVSLLIQSHPRKPLGKAILDGEEARDMILASISQAS